MFASANKHLLRQTQPERKCLSPRYEQGWADSCSQTAVFVFARAVFGSEQNGPKWGPGYVRIALLLIGACWPYGKVFAISGTSSAARLAWGWRW
jgi:hypothetical protein